MLIFNPGVHTELLHPVIAFDTGNPGTIDLSGNLRKLEFSLAIQCHVEIHLKVPLPCYVSTPAVEIRTEVTVYFDGM